MKTKITFADGLIILLCLLLSLTLFFAGHTRDPGDSLVIRDLVNEQETVYSLHEDRELTLTGNGYTLTVTIRSGTVCVSESDCPDQICVHGGEIHRAGETLVCAKAGISLTICGAKDKTPGEEDPDAIAG